MPSTPWIVSTRKREISSSTPPARKRRRNVDPPDRTTRQQTLTQAHWVTSAHPSFVDDAELKPIGNVPRRLPGRKNLKRDSTLTQMDFFNRALAHEEETNDELLQIPENGPEYLSLPPQLDGIYETPRKRRNRKSSLTEVQEPPSKRPRQSQGSREFRPSSRKGNISDTKEDAKPRRTSGRIAQRATILSDPAENLEYFENSLSQSIVNRGSCPRNLETQDSTAPDDCVEQLPTQSHPTGQSHQTVTPRKQRAIVLSSQSPVSISPSKKWTAPYTELGLRSPLQERSVNVPTVPHPTPLSDNGTDSRPTSSRSVNSNALKKKPRKPKIRVEDSQANLWSLPESSSSQKKPPSKPKAGIHTTVTSPQDLDGLELLANESVSLEIPSTSQIVESISKKSAEMDENTVSIVCEVTGLPEELTDLDNLHKVNDSALSEGVATRDFADIPLAEAGDGQQGFPEHNENAGRMLVDDTNEISDYYSDFGSPIANDTQFNFDLEHRTSSPSRTPSQRHENNGSSKIGSKASMLEQNQSNSKVDEPSSLDSFSLSQPTPRLVQRFSPHVNTASLQQEESGSDQFLLPQLPRHGTSITQTSISRIPLNDVQLSSSSVLPLTKFTTQRSIHPASMPRPSQISTQEATQGYLGQSSMICQDQETETPLQTDKITIKDSSSIRVPLSQIPPHIGSQLEPGVDFEEDDLDNYEVDYDLDPPSSEPSALMTRDLPPQEKFLTNVSELSPRSLIVKSTALPPLDHQHHKSASRGEPTHQPDVPQPPSSPHSPSQSTQTSQSAPLPLCSPPKGHYTPIPGFDNETQSNFTQYGHVTAAYIHRQRERGALPKWYIPKPYRVPGYTRR